MKISHTQSKTLTVCLTENERAALDGDRVVVEFLDDPQFFISLRAAPEGMKLLPRRDFSHPYTLHTRKDMTPANLPIFGTEVVKVDASHGILRAKRPHMRNPVQKRHLLPKKKEIATQDGELVVLKEAIKIVNNSKKHFRDQLVLEVTENGLEARLSINLS